MAGARTPLKDSYAQLDRVMSAVLDIQRQLMDLLLDGERPVLNALRVQYAACEVERVEATDVGFFVHFKVPASVPPVEPPNFEVGDVWFTLVGAQEDAGLVLFVLDGRLDMFEGFNWTDPWPEELRLESYGYLAVGQRQRDEVGRERISLLASESRDFSYLMDKLRDV